jgi:hypothetical protein
MDRHAIEAELLEIEGMLQSAVCGVTSTMGAGSSVYRVNG